MKKNDLTTFYVASKQLADNISRQSDELIALLSGYETRATAKDEIDRTLSALAGFEEEFSSIRNPAKNLNVSTFFPLNLPLYSLILFGVAPSAFAKNVFIRPPEIMQNILGDIFDFLELAEIFPSLSLQPTPRHIFLDLYASESDVIIFTGKYENALAVHEYCPQALLIYNGSGINPFIIFDNANLDLAAAKAVEMRCFNSGQDCAGPDAFFVSSLMADSYTGKLQAALEQIKVGDSADPSVQISRTIKSSYISQVEEVLESERENIVYGGHIDKLKQLVYPTIIRKKAAQHIGEFHEFFSPIFYILEYADQDELASSTLTKEFRDRSMYISLFGSDKFEKKLGFARVLRNQIVNDIEQGNQEYGGFGKNASFTLYGNNKKVAPMLISRELHSLGKPLRPLADW